MNTKKCVCFLFLLLLSVCYSCENAEKEERRAKIAHKEIDINSNIYCEDLRILYNAYINDFPDDLYAPEYLFRIVRYDCFSDLEEAITLMNRVIDEYPQSAVVPNCYFEKTYIFDHLEKYDSARKSYQDLVDKFPEHYLVLLLEPYTEGYHLTIDTIEKTNN